MAVVLNAIGDQLEPLIYHISAALGPGHVEMECVCDLNFNATEQENHWGGGDEEWIKIHFLSGITFLFIRSPRMTRIDIGVRRLA